MSNKERQPQFARTQGFYEGNLQTLQELSSAGRGKLVLLLTGPNGVGKGTIEQFLQEDPSINFVKPLLYTSRPLGVNEQQDKDYHFTSSIAFENMIGRNKFLQWSKLGDNYYGNAMDDCKNLFEAGKNIILEPGKTSMLNLNRFLTNSDINCVDICLSPIDPYELNSNEGIEKAIETLRERMTERRRGESDDVIASRLEYAHTWLRDVGNYSHIVANTQNNASDAVDTIKSIILREIQR